MDVVHQRIQQINRADIIMFFHHTVLQLYKQLDLSLIWGAVKIALFEFKEADHYCYLVVNFDFQIGY